MSNASPFPELLYLLKTSVFSLERVKVELPRSVRRVLHVKRKVFLLLVHRRVGKIEFPDVRQIGGKSKLTYIIQ